MKRIYLRYPIYKYVILLIPFLFLFDGCKNLYWFFANEYADKESSLIWGVIFSLGGVYGFVTLGYQFIVNLKVIKKYKNGEYQSVSGQIKNLHIGFIDKFQKDSFTVNETKFEIGFYLKTGLQKTAGLNGQVHENDQNVDILYVPYDEYNFIIEIDIHQNEEMHCGE